MFEIKPVEGEMKQLLDEFKAREYPEVDREHYGDVEINFTKYHYLFAAQNASGILGYIRFQIDGGVAMIESLLVGKEFRHQGIASALINEAEEVARSHNAHRIRLETGADWKAKALYEKLGYCVRAHLPKYYGKKDFILMDKEL